MPAPVTAASQASRALAARLAGGGCRSSGRVLVDLADQFRPQRRREPVPQAMHQDETAVGHRPGQRPARGRPDDWVLVSVQHKDRLGDAGDAIESPTRFADSQPIASSTTVMSSIMSVSS